jgi:hypothetical protein
MPRGATTQIQFSIRSEGSASIGPELVELFIFSPNPKLLAVVFENDGNGEGASGEIEG